MVNTISPLTLAVLPIGEWEAGPLRSQVAAITTALTVADTRLALAEPVSDEIQARQAVQELSGQGTDLLVLLPLRGLSAPVIAAAVCASSLPCLVWPLEGRFALPSSLLAIGALRDGGVPVEIFYAPPDHSGSAARLQTILTAAKAYTRLRHSRIGLIGGLFPNLISCRYDPQAVTARLGVTLIPLSFDEVRQAMRVAASGRDEIARFQQGMIGAFGVPDAEAVALEPGICLHLALQQIAQQEQMDAFAVECWSALPRELGLNPCLGMVEDAYTLACEGDVLLAVSLLIARWLTGAAAYAGDLFDLDLDGMLTLVHCGAPAALAAPQNAVVLTRSQLAGERGFTTFTCRPRLAPGPVTLFRLYGENCDRLHLASGNLVASEQSPDLRVKIRLAGDRWDFLSQCYGNHYAVAAGDLSAAWKLLSKWLGITVFET